MSRGQIEFCKQVLCPDKIFLKAIIQPIEKFGLKFFQSPIHHLHPSVARLTEIPAFSPKDSKKNALPFADAFKL